MRRGIAPAAGVLAALALAACETTGDPRQGGLLGWSEDKAQQRGQALKHDADEAARSAGAERAKGADMQQRHGALQSDVGRLQSQLDRMLQENRSLETELARLLATRKLKADDVARARARLAENERVRRAALASAREAAPPGTALVEQQNRRMHEEILFLLEQ